MKRIIYLFIILPLTIILLGACFKGEDTPSKNQALLQVMMQGLKSAHYIDEKIDDNFSKEVYDLYIQRLDVTKKFLLQEDIDKLKKYQNQIDDQINSSSFEFFDMSDELMNRRLKEAEGYYKEILAKPFDFNADETIETEPDKIQFAKTTDELKEQWRKYLKYQTLVRLDEAYDTQEKLKANKDTVIEVKSFEQLESDARARVLKTQDELFKRLAKMDKTDRLAIYINSIANAYDPHTEYFPPKDKENFDIQMTGRLEGIGATLQEKDGFIKVAEIVPGSPSYRQGQLKAGDIILKVAQGKNEPVDVVDMRLDKAVEMIRGKKGTEVRLTVKKPDGTIIIIPIIRDVVVLEESYAKSAVIKEGKKNVGYIKLPGFYADFNHKGGRNSSTDVKKELQKLKEENVEGIILDLRNNGGGSLQDVVDMMGYFIDKGPVVQVKPRDGSPSVLSDHDPEVVYDGPLVVMVNSFSASASEILAAAVQDYKRGVVIGSNSTFGKGTVQRFFNLDDYVNREFEAVKPLGSVKFTMQKFYRVNGDATQLKGVIPDVIIPDQYSFLKMGEKEMEYPLPWDEISPVTYGTWKPNFSIDKVKAKSAERIKASQDFMLINDLAKKAKERSDSSLVSLNFKKHRTIQDKQKEENKKIEQLEKKETDLLNVIALKNEAAETDTVKSARSKDWIKNLKKDIYLMEATNVLKDMK